MNSEIQRVREIHAALDWVYLHMSHGASTYTVAPHRDASICYTYTAKEIRAFEPRFPHVGRDCRVYKANDR